MGGATFRNYRSPAGVETKRVSVLFHYIGCRCRSVISTRRFLLSRLLSLTISVGCCTSSFIEPDGDESAMSLGGFMGLARKPFRQSGIFELLRSHLVGVYSITLWRVGDGTLLDKRWPDEMAPES
jgi:hypothetical protein